MKAEQKRVMVRKKAQVCPICKKPAATLLEWPQLNWWPSILCWPCVQEHIEKDHAQLEAAQADYAEADKDNYRLRQALHICSEDKRKLLDELEATQQERDEWKATYEAAANCDLHTAIIERQEEALQAERTKREEAERERDAWRRVFGGWTPEMAEVEAPKILWRAEEAERAFGALSSLAAAETEALGAAERRLGEALAMLERWHMWSCEGRRVPPAKLYRESRAVLASQTEEK